jgi:hypothetical protein
MPYNFKVAINVLSEIAAKKMAAVKRPFLG